jgi:CBS domain-containing protein
MNSPLSEVLRDKGESSKIVHTIAADATVAEAVRRMNQHKIGALLVVDGPTAVGIFTERDVLQRVVATTIDAASTPVAAVMTRAVVQVHPTTLVEQAMAIMTEKRCRHLPVMQGGQAVGMVSIGDLTRWMVKGQSIAIKDLIEYIQGKYPG